MDSDGEFWIKFWRLLFPTVVVLLGLATVGGAHCERIGKEAFSECVKAGKSPAECALATKGIGS